jgi:hypothetical protein
MDIKKYKEIPYETRSTCMICETPSSGPIFSMPEFPLTEIYVKEKMKEKLGFVDQSFEFCSNCGHGQLTNVVDIGLQYGHAEGYFFRASESISGRRTAKFFINFFNQVVASQTFDTIIELGCNDLYLLKQLQTRAKKLIGIDPILKGKETEIEEENLSVVGDFFENVEIDSNIDIVICKDTLEHISDPKQFVKKIVDKGSENTKFFFQFPLLEPLLTDCRFDQVYHQHLNYFSLSSIIQMLDELGCGLIDYTVNYEHWGSIIIAFKKKGDNIKYKKTAWQISSEDIIERYQVFKQDLENTGKRLQYFKNEVLYGYGAALMLPVLSYYLKNDLSCLECIIDEDESKEGLYYINLPISIKHSNKIKNMSNAVIIVTATFSNINTKMIMKHLLEIDPKHIIYPLRTI